MRHFIVLLFATFVLIGSSCSLFKDLPTTTTTTTTTKPEAPAQYAAKSGVELQRDYILSYKDAAQIEMQRGGVPASIILAQGLLESAAGQSELAREANNHFGVKCGGTWKGSTYKKKDDDRDSDGNLTESCFRKYTKVAESYYDHGEFLRDPKKANRYGFLFNLDRTDYKGWARGLQSAGYATSSDYSDKLINLIERYQLYEYDQGRSPIIQPNTSPNQPVKPTDPGAVSGSNPGTSSGPQLAPLQRIGRINNVKVVLSQPGESLDDVARLYRISTDKVVNYNERHYPPGFKLAENTRIFIQDKRSKWSGRATEHFVQEGQTMFDISQQYGVCLEKLLSRNGLRPNEEPAVSEKIKLKGTRPKSDVVRLRDIANDPLPVNAQPGTLPSSKPAVTTDGKMTTEDEPLFEIEGDEENKKPTPATTIPTQPTLPPAQPRPATSGNNPVNPSNPNPPVYQPNNTWQPSQPVQPPVQVPSGYHLVQPKETLYAISRKYSLTVPRLKELNNLKNDNIQTGQMLRIR